MIKHELVEHGVDVGRLRERDGLVLSVTGDLDVDEGFGLFDQVLALEPRPVVRPELISEITSAAWDEDEEIIDPDSHLDVDRLRADSDGDNHGSVC